MANTDTDADQPEYLERPRRAYYPNPADILNSTQTVVEYEISFPNGESWHERITLIKAVEDNDTAEWVLREDLANREIATPAELKRANVTIHEIEG